MLVGGYMEDINKGVDYVYQNHNIIFYEGERRKSLIVRHIDDNIVETDEEYNLTIIIGSLHSRVTVGKYGTTTVVINDDDGEYYECQLVICGYICILYISV